MESHYTTGYGDGKDAPEVQIDLLPGAKEKARTLLSENEEIAERMNQVALLIEGYEDSYGLELLSSLHWVMTHHPEAVTDREVAVEGVLAWNEQKRRRLKPEHLEKAWERLSTLDWAGN